LHLRPHGLLTRAPLLSSPMDCVWRTRGFWSSCAWSWPWSQPSALCRGGCGTRPQLWCGCSASLLRKRGATRRVNGSLSLCREATCVPTSRRVMMLVLTHARGATRSLACPSPSFLVGEEGGTYVPWTIQDDLGCSSTQWAELTVCVSERWMCACVWLTLALATHTRRQGLFPTEATYVSSTGRAGISDIPGTVEEQPLAKKSLEQGLECGCCSFEEPTVGTVRIPHTARGHG
jgi:hypothetical protein